MAWRDAALTGLLAFGLCTTLQAVAGPAAAPAEPSTALAARIDAVVQQILDDDGTPSASIAVVLHDRLAYAAAYGNARREPRTPATTRTRYQLASISKTFTAEAALLLEHEQRLDLADPVSRWWPGLSGSDRVTVRDLLQHTSGYPDHYPQTYPAGPRRSPVEPEAIVQEWGRHALLFAPGSAFRYSNTNYVIAGRIVEKVSGQALFTLLSERIFAPLGMSGVADLDAPAGLRDDVAVGYSRVALSGLQVAPDEGAGWSFGAGQVVATATDVARWDEAFLRGTLLPAAQATDQITAPMLASGARSPYALGLFVGERGGRRTVSHSGQGLGFLALNMIYPQEHVAVVVLTNSSSTTAFARIADAVAALVLAPTSVEASARALFDAFQHGRPDRPLLSAAFNDYLEPARVRLFAESLAALGRPISFVFVSESESDGLRTRRFDVDMVTHQLRVTQLLLQDGRTEDFVVVDVTPRH